MVAVAHRHIDSAVCRAASTFAPVGSSVAQFAEASRALVKRTDATKADAKGARIMVRVCL